MPRSLRLFALWFFALVAVDQLVKWWARAAVDGVEGRSLWAMWPGVFELKLVYNHGIAFGMLQGKGVFMAPIALAMAGAAAWYSYKHKDDPAIVHITTGLLAAGAVGNLIDRLAAGKVTDMFWIRLINFPVFNVADMCITFAGAMLVLGALRDVFVKKPEPAPAPQERA